MRVAILTASAFGTASRCLPELMASEDTTIAAIILVGSVERMSFRKILRKVQKVRKIGLWGAVNGIRLRKWYCDTGCEDLRILSQQYRVALVSTSTTNGDDTKSALRNCEAELGISLGNSYIAKALFSIPRYGMINLHGEILPDFKGAQSVIWPIYEGRAETGFTIHQVSTEIDGGEILYKETYPIKLCPTLRKTVEETLKITRNRFPKAIRFVCENYLELRAKALAQTGGKKYTTPSWPQFLRMLRNHHKMYSSSSLGVLKYSTPPPDNIGSQMNPITAVAAQHDERS
jgi:methionyl-tRNA formyltransferase